VEPLRPARVKVCCRFVTMFQHPVIGFTPVRPGATLTRSWRAASSFAAAARS